MATEPRLYLDTNVILDVLNNRWEPSKKLLDRIRIEHWKCITSRFTFLEMLDVEHEQRFIENLMAEGYPLSRVRDLLGTRRQKSRGLPKRDLESVIAKLYDAQHTMFSCIEFQWPVAESFWNRVDEYCAATNLAVADAMHLAFAIESEANILVSRDKDFCAIADDFIIAIPPDTIDSALAKLNKIS